MKKITLLCILFLCCTLSNTFAQAFKKNNLILTGGFGASAGWFYKNASGNASNSDFLDLGLSVGYTFPFAAEFAIHNKWGIGASFSQQGYSNTSSDRSNSNNFGVFGAWHFVSKEKVELYTRLNVGLSRLTYKESDSYSYYDNSTGNYYTGSDYVYNMNGWFAKPSFGLRVFFTEHIGIFSDGGIGIYSLNTNKYEVNGNSYSLNGRNIKLTMVGAEITAGVAFKL
jgi:hypothetical protein